MEKMNCSRENAFSPFHVKWSTVLWLAISIELKRRYLFFAKKTFLHAYDMLHNVHWICMDVQRATCSTVYAAPHKKNRCKNENIIYFFLFVFICSVCVWHTIERNVIVWKSVHWTVTRMPIARFFFVERSRCACGYHIHVGMEWAYKATGWNNDAMKLMT